ncbi:hypothetical protein OG943_24720 [Amycolatopsis sp. NBC_00345]|uniref:beta-ketoacyl synthase N-terminal-like domain-containing protein n=1 Tax=Amycolatopsis sp. NBC_00345 TaxID=2975955 RepID=UPI002E2526B2
MSAPVVAEGNVDWNGVDSIRAAVPARFADPVAWLVARSVGAALAAAPAEATANPDEVGVILVSAHCTSGTLAAVAEATKSGRLSPMRFAAASPGTAGSISCIVHGFRGPSLTLATAPAIGLAAAQVVARGWLTAGAARYVVLSSHTVDEDGRHAVHSTIFGAR